MHAMMKKSLRAFVLAASAAVCVGPSSALPFKLPQFLQGAASAPPQSAPAQPQKPGATTAARSQLDRTSAAAASAAAKSEQGLSDLKPDKDCSRPREGFDVMAKVVEFGGENARLRFERLMATDFKFSELTPKDKAMMKYVAYTTVWIPPELENKLGAIYTGKGGDASNSPSARRSMERIGLLKQQVSDFPGEIRLAVLRDMPNGASAQAGAVISIAQGFVSDLESQPSARDLILAHELSHVYKRHSLKEIQHSMVSSAAGWSIAKRLLGRSVAGKATGAQALTQGLVMIQVGLELVDFVKGLQISFNHDQELEADACAAVWMKRAKLDTTDAWKAFETVSATPGNAGKYFDQHPSSKERRARFTASAARASASADKPGAKDKTAPKP